MIHIQLGAASILVDAGFDDLGSEWEAKFAVEWPEGKRTLGLTAGLGDIGLTPDDITHVLITHVHFDHIAGLTVERNGERIPRFPNATVFVGRSDWENNPDRGQPDAELSRQLGPIERLNRLRLVDGVQEVVPGVTMISAPGESAGHCMVRVSSRGETFFAVGDLFHDASEVEHFDWVAPWVDQAAMLKSRKDLAQAAKHDSATVVYTHHPFSPWGRIVDTSTGQRWKAD